MAKPKINAKELLLQKGEYIALGIAGVVLFILLISGVMQGTGAEPPAKTADYLTKGAAQIQNTIKTGKEDPPVLPKWVNGGAAGEYSAISVKELPQIGSPFDRIAKPDTRRDNPQVVAIEDYRVDLTRVRMKGYDIIYESDGSGRIAVREKSESGTINKDKMREGIAKLKPQLRRGQQQARPQNPGPTFPQPGGQFGAGGGQPFGPGGGQPFGPGGGGGQPFGPGGGGGQPFGPGGGPGGPRGPGGPGGGQPFGPGGGQPFGPGGYSGGFGLNGTGYDSKSTRSDTKLTYIPIEDLDKATDAGKYPALTVIPLRLAVIHATIPLKAQAEEIKRALRLPTLAEAYQNLSFDGFKVKRRVTDPNGFVVGTGAKLADLAKNRARFTSEGFADYDYEQKYIEVIESRSAGDHFEGGLDPKNPRKAYLPHFYRYEDNLVMSLPALVSDLDSYPDVNFQSISDEIDKLVGKVQAMSQSDLAARLQGKGGRQGRFRPKSDDERGSTSFFSNSPTGMGGARPGGAMPPPGGKGPREGGVLEAGAPKEIEHLLLRFIDCDIKPGFTYEYQIQLQLNNPNFGEGNAKLMAVPAKATDPTYKVLSGPWVQLQDQITVPNESFVYAYDQAAYRSYVDTTYKDQPELQRLLQLKDNHAVVQMLAWMEQVRTDASGQREPVGGWVAAEMPVGRGEFIGKKTYVKLPLWSSENEKYILRELPASALRKGKSQPKGWLVDFSSKSVLVDYEGGRVRTKLSNGRSPLEEEVATEMLIALPDGTLQYRNSQVDERNENRLTYVGKWKKWLQDVEANGGTSAPGGPGTGQYDRGNKQ